ncbi:hypothetical protein BDR07DRAFT_1406533 [Suillus spraguei]|nr:hypothetical protein BDR07DRAFT_1406533 [Suillus spraguei]
MKTQTKIQPMTSVHPMIGIVNTFRALLSTLLIRPPHHHVKYHCCITSFMATTISSNQL